MIDRHRYVESLKARLDEWNRELDTLERRLKSARADVEQHTQQAAGELKDTGQRLALRIDEIAAASDDAWQRTRLSLERAWEDVKRGLGDVRAELLPAADRAPDSRP